MSLDTLAYMKSENLNITRKICGQIKVDKKWLGRKRKKVIEKWDLIL